MVELILFLIGIITAYFIGYDFGKNAKVSATNRVILLHQESLRKLEKMYYELETEKDREIAELYSKYQKLEQERDTLLLKNAELQEQLLAELARTTLVCAKNESLENKIAALRAIIHHNGLQLPDPATTK
jgi:uncharacterized protein (DUF342 family)